jgi:mersacidin/lichenicidin family type 2 lantibiotic
MPNEDIIRAWKDENYFHELSTEARANIPNNPAGEINDLSEAEMSQIVGGEGGLDGGGAFFSVKGNRCGVGSAVSGRSAFSIGATCSTDQFAPVHTSNCHPRTTQSGFCAPVLTQGLACNYTVRCIAPTVKYFCDRF